jgi:hypothetical protein
MLNDPNSLQIIGGRHQQALPSYSKRFGKQNEKLLIYKAILEDLQKITVRELVVSRSVHLCTNCNQRARSYISFNVSNKKHKLLCKVCCDLLYVNRTSLRSKYKLRNTAAVVQQMQLVQRVLFRQPDYDAVQWLWCFNKQDVARAIGFDSWEAFIQNNYKNPLPFTQFKPRAYHFTRNFLLHY